MARLSAQCAFQTSGRTISTIARSGHCSQDVCGNTAQSWQGDPLARPRCIPPAHDAHPASSRSRHRIVSPIHHSQDLEPSRSTCTEPWRTVMADPAPLGRSLRAPPRPPWPTVRRLDAASVLPLNHAREISLSLHPSTEGVSPPSEPRAGLGAFPLPPAPNHGQTMRPFDRRVRWPSRFPQPECPRPL